MGAIYSCLYGQEYRFDEQEGQNETVPMDPSQRYGNWDGGESINVQGANNAEDPHIEIFGHKIHQTMTGRTSKTVLQKISKAVPNEETFRLFDRPVVFLDENDRTNYVENPDNREYYMDYNYHLYGTMTDLLGTVTENGRKGLGTLFVVSELCGWTGREDLDYENPEDFIGHEWAGILVKMDLPGEEAWCLNIYCTESGNALPYTQSSAKEVSAFLNWFSGRRKLWGALQASGIDIREVNVSNESLTDLPDTCVLNTWNWVYRASKMPGGPWEESVGESVADRRLWDLGLRHVASGSNLFDKYKPLESCPPDAGCISEDPTEIIRW
ncbi:hypothetical protein DM02DRAFT_651855 [Periconia macrospinosa]|uniref:Uncharacterized protein n=1 Tax=Periconia macrospinosa TaxID=97972 RepID=A0A2V1E123_9PLEO|nr:hypothetical protein DM02DRAFT_651855 [Periconia macrospinosa]